MKKHIHIHIKVFVFWLRRTKYIEKTFVKIQYTELMEKEEIKPILLLWYSSTENSSFKNIQNHPMCDIMVTIFSIARWRWNAFTSNENGNERRFNAKKSPTIVVGCGLVTILIRRWIMLLLLWFMIFFFPNSIGSDLLTMI